MKLLLIFILFVGVALTGAYFFFAQEKSFVEAYARADNALLLDVRTAEEYASGHIQGAANIDFYAPDFIEQVEQLADGKDLYLYCRSGSRSAQAAAQLTEKGYTVVNMEGGLQAYTGDLVQ